MADLLADLVGILFFLTPLVAYAGTVIVLIRVPRGFRVSALTILWFSVTAVFLLLASAGAVYITFGDMEKSGAWMGLSLVAELGVVALAPGVIVLSLITLVVRPREEKWRVATWFAGLLLIFLTLSLPDALWPIVTLSVSAVLTVLSIRWAIRL